MIHTNVNVSVVSKNEEMPIHDPGDWAEKFLSGA